MESNHSSSPAKNITNPQPQVLHPLGFKSLQQWGPSSSESYRTTPTRQTSAQNKPKPSKNLHTGCRTCSNLLWTSSSKEQPQTAGSSLSMIVRERRTDSRATTSKRGFWHLFVEVLWHLTSKRNSRKADTINNNVKQLQLAFLDQWIPANPSFFFRSPPQQSFYFAF